VAEVALKESRRLVLGLRETPLSAIALENSLKLARLGVTIMPLSPAFYLKDQTPDEMVSHFVDHLLTTLHLESRPGWREESLCPSKT
jgi:4-hydroxy-3-polyprenylbenzoate decarboxylase